MESLKTLVNALRVLFDGVDSKLADVRNGLARVWEWINGLAWVARSETIERLPETTVHFEGTWNGDNQISAPLGAIVNTAGLVAGQKYTVYFDGNAHPMYYYVGEGSSGFFYDLDNLLFGGDFTLVGNSTEWTAYLTGGASGTSCNESHTFSIPAEVKPEEKLPNIFLDMDWIPKAGTVDLLTDYVIADHPDDWDSQGTSAGEQYFYEIPAPLFRLNAGETLTITWGGEEYSCVVTIVDVENYHIPAAGNLSFGGLGGEDNGMPFLFADLYTAMNPSPDVLVFCFVICVADDRAESFARSPLTVRANRVELPEEMLPQSVKEDIDGKLNARNPSGTGYFEMNPWYDTDGNVEYTPGQFSFNAGWRGRARGDYAANIGSGAANGKRSVNIGSGAANGDGSIAIGYHTQAASAEQTAMGLYNIADKVEKYLFILGNGSGDASRSNAFTVTPAGNGWFAGDVYVGSTSGSDMDEGSVKLLKEGGDGSNLTASYTVPDVRESLTSGEKLSTALGKIAKWLGALGSLAFKSTVAKTDLDTALRREIEDNESSTKLSKVNPTGTGSLSMNRDADSVVGTNSVAVGSNNTASGQSSFAEGNLTVASGGCAHAEGLQTTASAEEAHAEGAGSTASGNYAHAEGRSTIASGAASHAEGYESKASDYYTHAEGNRTEASGNSAHAEGQETAASGDCSHAEGNHTIAASECQHVQGTYNVEDATGRYAHIVGNGGSGTRSNAHTLDWRGNSWFAGKVYVGGTSQDDAAALDETVVKYADGSFYTADGTAIDVDIGGGGGGGGSDVVVDEALNNTSTNPVQNKAINAAISEIRTTASSAANTAAGAASTASTASTKADAAQSAAETAQSAARNAKTAADNAATAASTAQDTADAAKAAAREAEYTADEAQTTAYTALAEARAAAITASGAMTKANPTGSGSFSFNRDAETTIGNGSVALGFNAEASGGYSFAAGRYSVASGLGAYTEGATTTASGIDSHAEGSGTIAASDFQHVQGKYNVADGEGKYAHIVGGGTSPSDNARENIHTLDWSGNSWYKGTIECTGIIMKSPDGKKYKVVVDNGGTLKVLVTA